MQSTSLRGTAADIYLSTIHPDYAALELGWLTNEWVQQTKGYNQLQVFVDRQAKILADLKAGNSRAVFQAIELLGLMAIWHDLPTGPSGEVAALVRGIITTWYASARVGSAPQRRDAVQMLRRLGSVLAGEQRGRRRQSDADRQEIWNYYHTILFRLGRAHRLVRFWTWSGSEHNLSKRTNEVAAVCGVPSATFKRLLGLDDEQWRLGIEECARAATAEAFKIAPRTVANATAQAIAEQWSWGRPVPRIRRVADATGTLRKNPLLENA